MMDDSTRWVVSWSGGADSTALLNWYAAVSSEQQPVMAISVVRHPNFNKHHLKAQNRAQENYLRYARTKGYHIMHKKIIIPPEIDGVDAWNGPISNAQSTTWLISIMPHLDNNDALLMGYIEQDGFWHHKDKFVGAFNALCMLRGIKASIDFPLEWDTKADIMKKLKDVPEKCWFSCEATKNGRPCGKCDKCLEIKSARKRISVKVSLPKS